MSDREILEAQAFAGNRAGIFAESAAVTSVAAAKKLRDAGVIIRDNTVVCNLTGRGLKQPEAIQIAAQKIAPIAPKLEALRKQVNRSVL